MTEYRGAIAVALTLLHGPVAGLGAQQQTEEERSRSWTNSADLSVVITTGNSKVTTFAVSDKFTYEWDRSRVLVEGSAVKTRTEERDLLNEDGVVRVQERSRSTAEEYVLSGRYRYRFYEGLFAFSSAGWQRNELAGIQNRYALALGFGYQLIEVEGTRLSAEVGADWTREDPVGSGTDDFVGGQIRTTLERTLTQVAKLDSELELLENLENTDDLRANWLTAITASLSELFAIKLSYLVRFDNEPVVEVVPPDSPGEPEAVFRFDKTDTRFAASVVVNF